MQSTFNLEQFINYELLKNLYEGWQKIKAGLSLAHKNLSTEIRQRLFPYQLPLQTISEETWKVLQARLDHIIDEDWQDAKDGVYPISLLFDADWGQFLQAYVAIWLDYPQTWQRIKSQTFQDLPSNLDSQKYPQYYRRNFHYQTDGYLSDHSANIYDLQVDILFNGITDAMRRRILKPLQQALNNLNSNPNPRILDVACGTGRTLKFIRATFPHASLYGIDLSAPYLRKANELLSQLPQELPQLVEGKAEDLPYQDNYFQAVTSVFLFHELPNPVRQKVIDECYRVLQSGGICIFADSMQLSDSPELETMMTNFPIAFHEPFYNDYIQDDLKSRLDSVGFKDIREEVHGFTKYWIAVK